MFNFHPRHRGEEQPPSPRHCEEPLRRSNPDCRIGKILDCFAALAMTIGASASAKKIRSASS
ncbi:hypothetical protein CO669_03520 [Bradyrhizobium sp. Y36]|nr:hypothetical protein CO669_03520 [Bradyrhizobium sp. Y36]